MLASSLLMLLACTQDDLAISPQIPVDTAINDGWTAGDIWVDLYDGNQYGTVQIGDMVWMTSNYNRSQEGGPDYYGPGEKWHEGEFWYDDYRVNSLEEKLAMGQLYTYEEAINLAPEGWRLPSAQEWEALRTELEMDGKLRKDFNIPQAYYEMNFQSAGKDCALLGYIDLGETAYFWSATSQDQYQAQAFTIEHRALHIKNQKTDIRSGLSVRYIKE